MKSAVQPPGELRQRTPEQAQDGGGALSRSQKNRLRRARSRSLYRSIEILTDREQTIDAQKTQIIEHARSSSDPNWAFRAPQREPVSLTENASVRRGR